MGGLLQFATLVEVRDVSTRLAEVIAQLDPATTPQVVVEALCDAHEHLVTARHELERHGSGWTPQVIRGGA